MNAALAGKLGVLIGVILGISGCTATTMLGRSTRALENVAKSMDQTRDVLRQSEGAMGELGTSLQSLRAPMAKLGSLEGPLKNLGSLATPLENLGTLAPGIDQLGMRLQGVETNLQALEKPLANVAALEGPLDRVRELETPLKTIASVGSDRKALVVAGVIFIGAWTLATFLALYSGFVLAMRRGGRGTLHNANRKVGDT
jgi:hypothetical protein